MTGTLAACAGCGQPCVPMADYDDRDVCHRCDDESTTIRARADRAAAKLQLERPVESYHGPAPVAVIAELVDALFPRDKAARQSARQKAS